MNAFRNAVSVLSAVVVMLGAVSVLFPNNSLKKPMRFLFCAIILLTALSVFSTDLGSDNISFYNVGDLQSYYDTDAAMLSSAEENISAAAVGILKKIGAEVGDITVNMNISDGRRISINSINIVLDKDLVSRRMEIRNTVKENFGIYPTLIFR